MNIFALSTNPVYAATYVCDKHASKMCVETAQMLVSALIGNGFRPKDMPLTKAGKPYKGGYAHHPATLWAGENWTNFRWLAEHGQQLCHEFRYRYGEEHACQAVIAKCLSMAIDDKSTGLHGHYYAVDTMPPKTAFAMCMPEEFKIEGKEVTAYRNYYMSKVFADGTVPSWNKGRDRPSWWVDPVDEADEADDVDVADHYRRGLRLAHDMAIAEREAHLVSITPHADTIADTTLDWGSPTPTYTAAGLATRWHADVGPYVWRPIAGDEHL